MAFDDADWGVGVEEKVNLAPTEEKGEIVIDVNSPETITSQLRKGLNNTPTRLGFYDGTQWTNYFSSDGFFRVGTATTGIIYNPITDTTTFTGDVNISNGSTVVQDLNAVGGIRADVLKANNISLITDYDLDCPLSINNYLAPLSGLNVATLTFTIKSSRNTEVSSSRFGSTSENQIRFKGENINSSIQSNRFYYAFATKNTASPWVVELYEGTTLIESKIISGSTSVGGIIFAETSPQALYIAERSSKITMNQTTGNLILKITSVSGLDSITTLLMNYEVNNVSGWVG